METGREYNVQYLTVDAVLKKGIVDDLFFRLNRLLNKEGLFYFIKERHDIKGDKVGHVSLKNGPVILVVKAKANKKQTQ